MYGKQTEAAIAAMSCLAEIYDGGASRLSAVDIADRRRLQRPRVAKVLSALSQAKLVVGATGPGGGFSLARPPAEITINDVFSLFERPDDSGICPFGGGVCGAGEPCPLHDELHAVREAMDRFLHVTTFEKFREAYQERGWRAVR